MGALVGAGLTYLLRPGPSGTRPMLPAIRSAKRGLQWAGKRAARYGSKGARWTAERSDDLWDRIPRGDIERTMRDKLSTAQESIDDFVQGELRDLRKAIRRRRRALGV
jgi:hypothetical protein